MMHILRLGSEESAGSLLLWLTGHRMEIDQFGDWNSGKPWETKEFSRTGTQDAIDAAKMLLTKSFQSQSDQRITKTYHQRTI